MWFMRETLSIRTRENKVKNLCLKSGAFIIICRLVQNTCRGQDRIDLTELV
jgi:hypothetical protein